MSKVGKRRFFNLCLISPLFTESYYVAGGLWGGARAVMLIILKESTAHL